MHIAPPTTALDGLSILVSLLAALSVASERLVEILKGVIPPLAKENKDPNKEGIRRAAIQGLAVVAGIVTVYLGGPVIKDLLPENWDSGWARLALGFLVSGGSGFWNGILGYIKGIKELKKSQALALNERSNH